MTLEDCDCDKRIDELEKYVVALINSNKRVIDQNHSAHQRAEDQAEKEREKSAQVLRDQLTEMIRSGDQSLKDHIDHQKEQVGAAFAASEKAILKAEAANEKRFDTDQQFRDQLREQMTSLMPREVAESNVIELREKIERSDMESMSRDEILRNQLADLASGQAATRATLGVVGAGVSIFLTIVVITVNVLLK